MSKRVCRAFLGARGRMLGAATVMAACGLARGADGNEAQMSAVKELETLYQGIGIQISYSLGRVMLGFGLAALVAIPLGFLIGMSALLTTTMTEMAAVVRRIQERDLHGRVRTIVGGAALSEAFAREIGADAYATDAMTAVDRVKAMMASTS